MSILLDGCIIPKDMSVLRHTHSNWSSSGIEDESMMHISDDSDTYHNTVNNIT